MTNLKKQVLRGTLFSYVGFFIGGVNVLIFYPNLLSKEEFLIAEDLGDYYRIEADNRDLNYNKYFEVGRVKKIDDEYNSFNTKRLSRKELIDLLARIGYK